MLISILRWAGFIIALVFVIPSLQLLLDGLRDYTLSVDKNVSRGMILFYLCLFVELLFGLLVYIEVLLYERNPLILFNVKYIVTELTIGACVLYFRDLMKKGG